MISISDKIQLTNNNISTYKTKEKINNIKNFADTLNNEKAKINSINKTNPNIDKKLMSVCLEFESILVNQMFKTMRKTINKDKSLFNGGQAEKIFEDMLYDKYSLQTVKNADFGLAKQIYNQLIIKSNNK